jgi:hypothetical protein
MAYMTIQSINDLYGLRGLAIRFAQGGHPRSSEVIRSDVKIWKITMLLMGKSTIYMAMFNSVLFVYQRVAMEVFCCENQL